MTQLGFIAAEVAKAEADYSNVSLEKYQREELEQTAKLINHYLPQLSELALRGFCLKATKHLQEKKQMTLNEIRSLSTQAQIDNFQIILDHLHTTISKILLNKNPETLQILDEALDKVKEFIKAQILKKENP